MNRTLNSTLGIVFSCSCFIAGASAQHADVLLLPDLVNGVIQTGAFDDDTKTIVSMNRRVFGADFGESDPGAPNFSDEPGFRALPGDFDDSSWGFNIIDTVYAWNGSDFSTVSPFTITLNFGPSPDITSPDSPGGFAAGFSIPIGDDGFDDHLNIFLDGPMDASADGVYLLTLEVFAEGFGASDPIYFVLNRGLSEFEHDSAIDYVFKNIVPTPGAAALLAIAGFSSGVSRRRRD